MSGRISIRRPDDFHLHLRDGEILRQVLPATVRQFARALIMPNLLPPIVDAHAAEQYRQRILAACPEAVEFEPLMTLYLTENTTGRDIVQAAEAGTVAAAKLYPAGATTNSDSGVRRIEAIRPVLDRMEAVDLPLCVHGEVTDPAIDVFDREEKFIDVVLEPIRKWNPDLRIVFEHITTAEAVSYVRSNSPAVAATITVHHLIINRNHLFMGGIRPHYFCLPLAKREIHRQALLAAVTGGEAMFFLGTDSAPHTESAKLNPCGCAGIFTAPVALSCLAHLFEEAGSLSRLEAFTSENGARFYRLKLNSGHLVLEKGNSPLQFRPLPVGNESIQVFDPGFPLYWDVAAPV
ncbi:MAG: dihydroorotase [Rhodobacteraceae bacterium]|nr:dihydroorotase [Paracoccaceae bacterium]